MLATQSVFVRSFSAPPSSGRAFAGFARLLICALSQVLRALGQNQSAELTGATLDRRQARSKPSIRPATHVRQHGRRRRLHYEGSCSIRRRRCRAKRPTSTMKTKGAQRHRHRQRQPLLADLRAIDPSRRLWRSRRLHGARITATSPARRRRRRDVSRRILTPDTANDYSDATWNVADQLASTPTTTTKTRSVAARLPPASRLQAGDEVIIFARGGLRLRRQIQHQRRAHHHAELRLGIPGFPSTSSTSATPACRRRSTQLDNYSLSNLDGWESRSSSIRRAPPGPSITKATGSRWTASSSSIPNDPNWVSNGAGHRRGRQRARTFQHAVGNSVFASAPTGFFNATGIFDQESGQGSPTGGYEAMGHGPERISSPHPNRRRWSWPRLRWGAWWDGKLRRRRRSPA